MRMFGWIDRVDDTCVVATEFVHLWGIPIWPIATHLVDSTTLETHREVEEGILATTSKEQTRFRSVPLPTDRRSVAAGYLRTWGTIAFLFGLAIATQWQPLVYIGIALFVGGGTLRRSAYIRLGDAFILAGLGAMGGVLGGIVSRPIAAVLAVTAGGAIAITLQWRRASAANAVRYGQLLGVPPDVIEMRRALLAPAKEPALPMAVAMSKPRASAPVAPVKSSAPAQVEQATDKPRFLS